MEVMGLLALTITILLRVVAAEDSGSQICLPAPLWETDGEAPMNSSVGQVTVVVLLKAS